MKKCTAQYIVIENRSDYHKIIWNDLTKLDNCTYFQDAFSIDNKFKQLFNKIHFYHKLNSIWSVPFKSIWYKYYSLEQISIDNNTLNYIILTDNSVKKFDAQYLRDKKNSNTIFVLVIFNIISKVPQTVIDKFDLFDIIFTFDSEDARKYGFEKFNNIYSKVEVNHNNREPTDLFYVGVAKNRWPMLISIFERLKGQVKCNFNIIGVNKQNQVNTDTISYNKWLTYMEVLQEIQNTNCILEILQEGQSGLTMRTMEAICYNKKLLTNNTNILSLPFYDERYIKIFKSVDDIDPEFITSKTNVDFGYNGEYSPINFLESMQRILNEKEKA